MKMKIMKNPHATTLVLAIAFVAAVVLIVAGLDLFASWLQNKSDNAYTQSSYSFIVDAKAMHEELEGSSVISDFEILFETIAQESPPGSADTELVIIRQQLLAQGYKESYYWLMPSTVDLIEVRSSLILEGRLFHSCYAKLRAAWIAKNRSGDESACIENLEEAREYFQEAISLRAKNKTDLDVLLTNTKQSLEQ